MSQTRRLPRRPFDPAVIGGAAAAAILVFLLALVLYVRTLLPGPSVGDWAEMQMIPAQLGIPHPTGYPLYVLLGKAFSLLPIGTVAWRADLLSAVAAAGAAGVAVLIAARLGVRPIVAAIAGLTLAATGTLWLEATFAEMNGLHLLLSAALIHRALVWRAERRDRDLRLGGLLAGLTFANHPLATTVVPIIVAFVLVDARDRFRERPGLLLQAALLCLSGVSLYLFIPLRAMAGPAAVYGSLATWDGLIAFVTGAQFRHDMHFGSLDSLATALGAVPDVVARIQAGSNLVFLAAGLLGGLAHARRDRWAAAMLALLLVANIYVFAGYVGSLEHYLLVTWLVLAIWLAVGVESVVRQLEARAGPRFRIELAALLLPIAILAANWSGHDQSANRVGEGMASEVFAALPADAVLLTYWDALTTLSYVHCIEGDRPDLSLRAFDEAARVTCDPVEAPLEEIARRRPVYALLLFDHELDRLRVTFDLVAGPRLRLPYGNRVLDQSGILYRLVPKDAAAR